VQNYDIRYDDKYGQRARIDVAAEGQGYEPWVNQTLTSGNDCVVRLAVIEGELVDWHSHEREDEFFLVLDGRLELEVAGREPFLLGVHQGVAIPRGVAPPFSSANPSSPLASRATPPARMSSLPSRFPGRPYAGPELERPNSDRALVLATSAAAAIAQPAEPVPAPAAALCRARGLRPRRCVR
jgi:mannose-6-phosphate isomerase-like protein (cupin superfamily)